MNSKKIDDAMMDCYRELYKYSNPPADFNELVEDADINEFGQKIIPYNDYVIDRTVLDDIVYRTIIEHKIPKHLRVGFKNTIYLGCSPKSK